MYKTGRQRYEKGGGIIYYPSEIEIEITDESGNGTNGHAAKKAGKNKKTTKVVKAVLRKALMCDVKSLYSLFSEYSKAGEMLPRSMSDIYEHLRDFYIAEIENEDESETGISGHAPDVIGACALTIVWENLAEIRSLAVKRPYTRKSIGTELIKKMHRRSKIF